MTTELLRLEEAEHGVFILTVNRPEALNALNAELIEELHSLVQNQLTGNPDIRVLLITGTGNKAFIAGADIKEFLPMGADAALSFATKVQNILKSLESLPCPVIALVNGFCLGGGSELALACDYIIASENAVFGQPETKIGVMTGWGGSQRLSRSIGKNRTMELLMTGRSFNAHEALSMGLVTQVVPPDALMSTGLDAARQLVVLPANALRLTKRVVLRGQGMELYQACELESQAFALCFSHANKNEGVNAFLEKRKPQFNAE